jgi:hypothetical protein
MFDFRLIRHWHFTSAKVFFSQRAIVKLLSDPEFIRLRKHHEGENTTQRKYVNTFLFIIFRMGQANRVPNQISLINEKIE